MRGSQLPALAVVLVLVALSGGGNPSRAVAAGDPVVAAAGDIACDPTNTSYNAGAGTSNNCRQRYTSDLLVGGNYAAVLPLGDNQNYCGSLAAYQQAYDPSWGRVKAISHPVPGNHEYLTDGSTSGRGDTGCDSSNAGAAGYFAYWGAQAGTPGQGWYSFDLGGWHIVALNTNCSDAGGCGSTSAQSQWLKSDLAAHPNQCLLATFHIPLFSSGGRASQNSSNFWNLLYAAHADVILDGHDHIYERFAPQSPTGTADPNGPREFIVGTGGENHTSIASVAANSQVRDTSTYGVLALTLHASSYDWRFVPEAGKTFSDSGSAPCHNTGGGGGGAGPSAPVLSLAAGDPNDFVSGSTVFYRPAAAAGAFSVAATSAGASSVQFPVVFGSDGLDDQVSPFGQTYNWSSGASVSGSFGVTAANASGTSAASQFTVSPDGTAPSTSSTCNGGPCLGSFSSPVAVQLLGSDTGSGLQAIHYTLDGSTPTTASPLYSGPFSLSTTTTVRFFAVDNVGNQGPLQSLPVTIGGSGGGGGGGIALVQQTVGSGSAARLPVSLSSPSTAGHTLVAIVALAAGSSASVSSVTDSAAGGWTKGPAGYQTGANSRVEIWYRLAAPSVTSVTITLSASKRLAADISEWSGIASTAALDGSAANGGASTTTVSTPALTTTNPTDLVLGAINYPAAATATLRGSTFTSLSDFSSSTSVHGHAAYLLTTTTGSYQTSWTLTSPSNGHGTAILALKSQ